MNKLYLIPIILLVVLTVNISLVDACSMALPYIAMGEEEKPYILGEGIITDDLDVSKHEEFFSSMEFVNQDINVISTLFNELKNNKLGKYRYIKKQTEEQYTSFKEKVENINGDKCDCTKLTIVDRIGDWTAYESSFKETCKFSTMCYTPPAPCSSALSVDKTRYTIRTIILPLVGVIIIISLIIFFIKKKK